MSIDTLLRTQLTSAVDDTVVPPGLALGAVAGGRRRRRRRNLAGGAVLAAVGMIAASVVQLPGGGSSGRGGDVASGASADLADGLAWARSLPEGMAPSLPFFGEGGLWSDGRMYDVPDAVNYAYPPRSVHHGWLVVTGHDEQQLALAVLAYDGSLRELPGGTFVEGVGDTRYAAVSPDGRRVAFSDLVVDVDTLDWIRVPHQPDSDVGTDNFATEVKVLGFTDDGLVYQGAPFEQGFGSTWLLRDDGTTAPVEPPEGSHISDTDGADVAVRFDNHDDDTDTCMTTYRLSGTTWDEWRGGCVGQELDEALGVSPEAEWLLTDDLPRVWSIADGRWRRLDMPIGVGPAQMDAQRGGAVWETNDTFLLAFADRWSGPTTPEPDFVQHVQVVRCSVRTLACERAGTEQVLPVVTTMWGTSQLSFAGP